MKEECEGQQKRKECIINEIGEVDDTIDQLKVTIDELNEQILRIDLKMNQAANEKLRFE